MFEYSLELIQQHNSRPDPQPTVNPRDSINAQAKDMQNLLENQGMLAQELDKVLKESAIINEKIKCKLIQSCTYFTY